MLDIQGFFNCILTTASVLTQFVFWLFRLSHSVGYFIVNFVYIASVGVCTALETFIVVLKVLYEDYCIFIVDVCSRVVALVSGVGYLLSQLLLCFYNWWNGLKGLILVAYEAFELCVSTLFSVISKILYFIGSIPELVKHVLILIGSSIWYIIWLVPLSILYSITLLIYLAGRGYEELYTFTCSILQGLFQMVTSCVLIFVDFPLEALFGLCAGALLGLGFYKYSSQIAYYGVHCFSYARQQIRQLPFQMWSGLIWLISEIFSRLHRPSSQNTRLNHSTSSEDSLDNRPTNNLRPRPALRSHSNQQPHSSKRQFHKQLSNDQESNLCVVCQDAEKCVVILPCRHVCLCKMCCMTIQRGSCECPVCRSPMISTLSVFL